MLYPGSVVPLAMFTWQFPSKEKVSSPQSKLGFYEWEGESILRGYNAHVAQILSEIFTSNNLEWFSSHLLRGQNLQLCSGISSKDLRNILLSVCGETPFPDFSSATVTVCFFAPLPCQPELPISGTRFYQKLPHQLTQPALFLNQGLGEDSETRCALYLDAGQKKYKRSQTAGSKQLLLYWDKVSKYLKCGLR